MPRSPLLYLNDISEAAGNIRSWTGTMTFSEFRKDRMRVDAVVRNFEIIGMAVRNLGEDMKKEFPSTNWKAVAGFRDTLVHEYFGIDLDILWDSIHHTIPGLQNEIGSMIVRERSKKP